jgi:hypothetical protein
MKKIIRLTESDLTRLVRRVLKEQKIKLPGTGEDPNTHRYDAGIDTPGFEKFLASPNDPTITNGLLNQLRKDPFGKGKIVIIFNGERFKDPQSFISKIRLNSDAGKCFTITDYEYNNRVALNTRITIKATIGECKKVGTPVQQQPAPKPNPETTPQPNPAPTPEPAPKKVCKHKLQIPFLYEGKMSEQEIIKFQKWCSRPDSGRWKREFTDGTSQPCTKQSIDGAWGCCSATCWRYGEKDYYDYLRNQQGGDNVGGRPFVDRQPKRKGEITFSSPLQTGDYRRGRDY